MENTPDLRFQSTSLSVLFLAGFLFTPCRKTSHVTNALLRNRQVADKVVLNVEVHIQHAVALHRLLNVNVRWTIEGVTVEGTDSACNPPLTFLLYTCSGHNKILATSTIQ
jgi:hypothetical protein